MPLLFAQPTGAVHGQALDAPGVPAAGVTAVATSVGRGSARYSATVTNSGDFQIAGLPVGAYTVCFTVDRTAYLNPCHWGTSKRVTITPGTTAEAGTFTMPKWARLQVRLNDPGKRLGAAGASPLLVAVMTPALVVNELTEVARDAGGRTLETLVPVAAAVNLSVVGARLEISDSAGHKLPASARIPVTMPSAAGVQTIVLTITGGK